MGVEVSIAEGGKGQRAFLWCFLGWVAIKLQKCDNIHSGGQMQKILPKPHKKVAHLTGLGLSFILGNLTETERMALPMIKKLAVPRPALVLERGHFLQFFCNCWQFDCDVRNTSRRSNFTVSATAVNGCNVKSM